MMANFANGGSNSDTRRQKQPQQRSVSFNDREVRSGGTPPSGASRGDGSGGVADEFDYNDIDKSGCTVWIGQLPHTVTGDPALLKDALMAFGSVASVSVREKPGPRKSWALATFYDSRAARGAANASRVELQNTEGRNVHCTVKLSDVAGQLNKDNTGWLATVASQQSQKANRAVQGTDGVSFGDDFQLATRGHGSNAPKGAATSRTAPFATHTRPGDGPVRNELWGKTEPDDWVRDKKQNHKPLHGFQSNLDQGENTGHEWDVRPDVGGHNGPNRASNLEAAEFGNRWGVRAGAQTMLSHHGKFGKKVQLANASVFQTSDDVSKSPWAGISDAKPRIKSGTGEEYYADPDELAERRIQLGPSQTWSKEPMDSSKSSRQEGRKMRDPRRVMPADALAYPYARGGHVKPSDMVIEPPNFGAPAAGSSVDEALTADVTGAVQYTHKPAIGPQRGHLDYSMDRLSRADTDPRQGRGSAHHTVDPAFARAGFHEGRYHVESRADTGASSRGSARHDLSRDARVSHPLRRATKFEGRDVRGGNYITVEHPMRFGKKPHVAHSPWLLSSDDVVKKTRRFADPRAWGAWHNERDPEEIDLGFFWGLGAEGRIDRSLPLGDQYNVARPGYAYHGPRQKPSIQTSTGGNTTELLHTHQAETVNHSIGLAVWEKDDAERIQYMRGVGRRGQTNTTRKQRAIGKDKRKELQNWRAKRLPEDPPLGVDAEEISRLPAEGRFGTIEERWAQPALAVRTNRANLSQARGLRFKPLSGAVYPPSKQPPPMGHGPTDENFALAHVHGAGGKNARGSMVALKNGAVVYFAGAVVVVRRPGREGERQHFYRGHDDVITSIAVHPEGKIVATGQGGSKPSVHIWDSDTGKEICRTPPFHEGRISCVSFSQDGQQLFTVGEDKFHTVAAWAWQGMHQGKLNYSEKEGDQILENRVDREASATRGWFLKPHDNPHRDAPRMLASARGTQASVLACCPAGKTGEANSDRFNSFVTCGVKTCKVWTLSMYAGGENELLSVDVMMGDQSGSKKGLTSALTCSCVCLLGDGSVLLGTTGGDVHQLARVESRDDVEDLRWRLISTLPQAHEGFVSALATHVDGIGFCSTGKDGRVVLWEPDPDAAPPPPGSRSGSRAKSSRASDNFSGSRASRQSTKRSVFSSMSSRAPVFTKIDGFVVGIEITALSEYLAALEEGSFARSVAIAMDEVEGQLTANIVSSTNAVLGVEMASLTPVYYSHGHAAGINAVASHPSARAYVTVSDDNTVAVWMLEPHRMLAATELNQAPTAVAIRPDGSVIAVGLMDGSVLLLDMGDSPSGATLVETGRLAPIESSGGDKSTRSRQGESNGSVGALSFSSDGEFLAVGDGKGAVTLHSIRSGFTKRVVLGGQGGGSVGKVSAVDFSVDGRWLRVETIEKTPQGGQPVHHLGYWDVGQQQRVNDDGEGGALDLRDEQWASYNSTVGWSVMGVWHGEDLAGVQSLDVAATWSGAGSGGGSVTAAASGSVVKLYRYPAVEKRPTARTLSGHGGAVRGVRFADRENALLSVGGSDQALMVWKKRQPPQQQQRRH